MEPTLDEVTERLNAHITHAIELLAKRHPAIMCSALLADGAKLELCLGEVFVTDGASKTPVLSCSRARRIEVAHAWGALVIAAQDAEDSTIAEVLVACDAIELVTRRVAHELGVSEMLGRAQVGR